MAEFSCYYEFCDTILVQWLMFDINPHPFLGADECIGDYMVWLIPYMFLLKVPEHDMTISDLSFLVLFLVLMSLGLSFLLIG